MSADQRPQLILVCGPNGAGKSTFRETAHLRKDYPVIDADKIAKDMGLNPVAAGREAYAQIEALLQNQKSFIRESTLTAKYDFSLMEKARQNGYNVSLVYIGLKSESVSVTRVANRHTLGGHDVPLDDLQRRYGRSMENMPKAVGLVDQAFIFDNSGKGYKTVAVFQKGELTAAYSKPKWFAKALANYNGLHTDINAGIIETYEKGFKNYAAAAQKDIAGIDKKINALGEKNLLLADERQQLVKSRPKEKKFGLWENKACRAWQVRMDAIDNGMGKNHKQIEDLKAQKRQLSDRQLLAQYRERNPDLAKARDQALFEQKSAAFKKQVQNQQQRPQSKGRTRK